jgi:periplasmic copper chaperone A
MKQTLFAALLSLSSVLAQAQAPVKVESAWVRGTVASQKATGAFMQITPSQDLKLVSASSPVAGVTEIHEMAMDKDVMRMRALPSLALPAGRTTELKPGGYHVMLMDLKAPVQEGAMVPLTLVFENAQQQRFSQELQLPVRPLGAAMGSGAAPVHGHSSGHRH